MSRSRLIISVVDDDEPVRSALRRLVGLAGFEVKTFASGRQFLDSLESERPACAILDLHLPELSGFEIQQALNRTTPSVPSIIITGRDEPGLEERARAAGAAGFLRKPLNRDILLSAIATVTQYKSESDTETISETTVGQPTNQ